MKLHSPDEICRLAKIYAQTEDQLFVENFIKRALLCHPKNTKLSELLAFHLERSNKKTESLEVLKSIAENDDCSVNSLYSLAKHFYLNNQINNTINLLKKIIIKESNNFVATHDLGLAYAQIGDLDNALKFFYAAMELNNQSPEILYNIGLIFDKKNLPRTAIDFYQKAIGLNSKFVNAWINLGVALFEINHFDRALEAYDIATKLDPMNTNTWMNKGVLYKKIKNFNNAIYCLNQSIIINQNSSESFAHLGDIYLEIKEYKKSISCYEKALKIKPHYPYLHGLLQHVKMTVCDWSDYEENIQNLKKLTLNDIRVSPPFPLISIFDEPELQLKSAQIWSKDNYANTSRKFLNTRPNKKTKIAYFSSDFYEHATMYLLYDVLKHHDKNKYEIYGFNFSPAIDSMTKRVHLLFDNFFDVSDLDDQSISEFAYKQNIDIAIDLKGYTQNARPKIFAYGVAPIQINFLGYPGTLGSDYISHIIADKSIIPHELSSFYSERVIHLTGCYQPNAMWPKILSPSKNLRKEFGLPADEFIFCSFNSNYKFTPLMVMSWVNILLKSNSSFFWCMVQSDEAKNNLLKFFTNHGINSGRIIFCNPVPRELHLKRIACADLFLDTYPCGAHTTASDAIKAGVPILTIQGKTFSSRVCASILSHLGINNLIAQNLPDYESCAIQLANNPNLYQEVRKDYLEKINLSDLFSPKIYVKQLELVYENLVSTK